MGRTALLPAGRSGSAVLMDLELMQTAQRRLEAAGFDDHLVADGESLRCTTSGRTFDPAELTVAEIVRFEGSSDPDDQAVLIAVSDRDGNPIGTYAAPFGPDAGPRDAAILVRLGGDHRAAAPGEADGPKRQ